MALLLHLPPVSQALPFLSLPFDADAGFCVIFLFKYVLASRVLLLDLNIHAQSPWLAKRCRISQFSCPGAFARAVVCCRVDLSMITVLPEESGVDKFVPLTF